jgi:hypothetical protein
MTDHSGQPVRAFPVGGQHERRIVIGEGCDPDDLQATGAWVSIEADEALDQEAWR